jgi:N-acetylmuramoyl-L-alanine amidase
MTGVRFGRKRWARASRLGLALSLGACLTAGAQPVSVPHPVAANRPVPDKADPIGALLARQGLAGPAANIPMVIGLKLGESAARSRFTMELSDPVDVRIFTLTNPNRVVIDMPDVQWRMPDAARPTGKAAVKSYRYGQFRKGNGRFIVDLNMPVKVSAPQMLAPEGGSGFRLVLDLTPISAAEFQAHAGWPADMQTASASPPPALRTPGQSGKPLVILDPGHGGIDPGTHGQTGIQEKDLVLSVAKTLRKALEGSGRYRVQLTRDSDVFIPLRGRVNIARSARADLFVSLHADSNDRRDIRGASVYTLSEDASDREAATLAEKENMSDVIAGVDLTGENNPVASILIDLAQRDTMNRSVRFAETVLGTLPAVTSIQPLSPHRAAGFAVLKAPDVPAVLIELGYLTNSKDESEMTTEAWRNRVAGAISAAVDAHFGNGAANLPQQAANP